MDDLDSVPNQLKLMAGGNPGRKPMQQNSKYFWFSLTLIMASCTKEVPLEKGTDSMEALVSGLTGAMAANDHDKIRGLMVQRAEYVAAIHAHTPEGKNVDGAEIWNALVARKRDLLTGKYIDQFKGKTCKTKVSGSEKKREKRGPVTFYRQVPVLIECKDKEKVYLDQNKELFGVVVEKNGVYKLLNIFTD